MKQALVLVLLLLTFCGRAQEVFFQSAQSYTEEEMESFYASLAVQGNLLLFNAPDYKLYAYDKGTGAQKWVHPLGRKSVIPPFFVEDFILANSGHEGVVLLDTATGRRIKTLPMADIKTAPIVRQGVLYGTGIYDLGCLFAYHLEKDTLLWTRFLAHGCARRPYYGDEMIWANAEGDAWLPVDYSGQLREPSCDSAETDLPSSLPCAEFFAARTHDGRRITGKLARRMDVGHFEDPEMLYAPGATLILHDETLLIVGNKLKIKREIPLHTLLPDSVEPASLSEQKLLKADGEKVWLLYSHQLMVYNYRAKKLLHTVDLEAWEPSQPLLDGERLWFVSRKDGRLYGIKVN
jgi:hypothetical protein